VPNPLLDSEGSVLATIDYHPNAGRPGIPQRPSIHVGDQIRHFDFFFDAETTMRVFLKPVKNLIRFFSTAMLEISEIQSAFAHRIHRNVRWTRVLRLTQTSREFNVTFVDG
jgi:hypothetical protein